MRILMMLIGAQEDPPGRGPGFDQVVECFYILRDAGAELVVASAQGGDPPYRGARRPSARSAAALDRLHADRAARDVISDTLRFAQVCVEDFDGGVCLGALEAAADTDGASDALRLVTALLAAGKPVAVTPGDDRLAAAALPEPRLIIGERARSPLHAAATLLTALGSRTG